MPQVCHSEHCARFSVRDCVCSDEDEWLLDASFVELLPQMLTGGSFFFDNGMKQMSKTPHKTVNTNSRTVILTRPRI